MPTRTAGASRCARPHAGPASQVEGRLLVTVSWARLILALDPLGADPWQVGTIPTEMVEAAIASRRLRRHNPCWEHAGPPIADEREAHAERIAWLVVHGWSASAWPPHLEVDQYGGAQLNDGNHRAYAAALKGLTGPVTIEVSGFLDEAEVLLGITIA